MQPAYTSTERLDVFSAAEERFQALLGQLSLEASAELAHGDIEQLIEREMSKLLRRLL